MQISRSWVGAGVALFVGALLVAAAVAVLIPENAISPSGLTGTSVAGASIPDPFMIETTGPTDVAVTELQFAPGASGGWHSHTGAVLVTVLRGTATFYDGDDPACAPHRYRPGTGLVEHPGHVHITRNEESVPLVLYVVTMVPAGKETDISQPRPGNCAF